MRDMCRRSFSPWSAGVSSFVVLTFLLALLSADAQALPYTAINSGNFNNTATWGGGPPGVGDDVTIPASITVDFSGTINVDSVTVEAGGTLIGTAWTNSITTTALSVDLGGVIQGFDNGSGSGGTIWVGPQNVGNLTVQNDGLMRGGNPSGHLGFYDGSGDASCSTNSAIVSNGGRFFGGTENGSVYMVSGTIDLFNAQVEGGSGFAPFNYFGQSQAGNVYISGHTIVLDGSFPGLTRVVSGTNFTGGGTAGTLAIMARVCGFPSSLFIGPTSYVNVGTPSIGGCPDVRLFSAGSLNILGTVGATGTSCAYWDPPDLVLSGDGRVTANDLLVVGDNFSAGGLNGTGLQASQSLKVILSPGGVLDLQGLTPGTSYFQAGDGITLCADEILLDPGVDLAELMEPAPVLCPGQKLPVLSVPTAVSQAVSPGDSITLILDVMNIGNFGGLTSVNLDDSAGWLVGGAQAQVQYLAPGGAITLTATILVPERPTTKVNVLELSGTIAGQPMQVETSVFLLQ